MAPPRTMGKGRKDAKGGQQYVLAHRSLQDPALYTEDASKFVFVPVQGKKRGQNSTEAGTAAAASGAAYDAFSSTAGGARTEKPRLLGETLDEFGFPLDGYDYSKHLKPMGGGVFVGCDGNVEHGTGHLFPQKRPTEGSGGGEEDGAGAEDRVKLPASVLPSATELDRRLDAVATDETEMDEDLRRLLFEEDGAEEDGSVVGDLEDDFVAAAMEGGGGGEAGEDGRPASFDFDAHVARLMAEAAKEDAAAGLGAGAARAGVRAVAGAPAGAADVHPDDLEEFSSEGEEEYEGVDSEGELEGGAAAGGSAGKQQALLDARFAAMIGQYDEEEMGELEAPQVDPDMAGTTDLNEGHEALLDELFEETQQVPVPEAVARAQKRVAEDAERAEQAAARGELPPANLNRERAAAGRRAKALARGQDPDKPRTEDYIPSSRAEREWDCETILTTLTNTDNLPTVIESDDDDEASVVGLRPGAERIRLSKKTGLPLGVLPGAKPRGSGHGRRRRQLPLAVAEEQDDESDEEEDAEDREDGEEDPEAEERRRACTAARPKGESAEEKRRRKQLVKEERRRQREKKKVMKGVFRSEMQKQKQVRHHSEQNLGGRKVLPMA